MNPQKHLGRGLDALLSGAASSATEVRPVEDAPATELSVDVLLPPRWQPRRAFDEQRLAQLADSIRSSGIIEPLIVSPAADGRFDIVCGERRFRAARLAGLARVPVIIRQLDDQQKGLLAVIENVQREDLNPVEEAEAFQRLMQDFGYTQEEVARLVGRDRSAVANALRLLSLPKDILDLIQDGLISAGHARSLASLESPQMVREVADRIVQDKLTVRDVEQIVRHSKSPRQGRRPAASAVKPAETRRLETELARALETKVSIRNSAKNRGTITIQYASLDEFERIFRRLTRS